MAKEQAVKVKVTVETLYCNTCDSEQPHVLQPGVCYHCLKCRSLGRDTKKPVALDRRYHPDPRD